jgi:hypothetical protein
MIIMVRRGRQFGVERFFRNYPSEVNKNGTIVYGSANERDFSTELLVF